MGRRGRRRRGLRSEPRDGWPLDSVLVGVATLRTMRELFRQCDELRKRAAKPTAGAELLRAWDLSLWSGVTPQGSIVAMRRLAEAGLVRPLPPARPGKAVRYRLDRRHALAAPLARLFEMERGQFSRGDLIGISERVALARREDAGG